VRLFVLDTDVLSLFQRGHAAVLRNVIAHRGQKLAITVITVEEQLSGRYALLRRAKDRAKRAMVYQRLADTVQFLSGLPILSFTEDAMARFDSLIALKTGVRAMDLRIAAIALEHGGTVVTRNTADFSRIPSLSIEDWTR
jgi:tRNA(fMet)-specific endonuclease VapC